MATWEFTLVVEGADVQGDELIDRLFEAGLDDATISRTAGVQLVDVARDADTYAHALLSALGQVRDATGGAAHVVRVEPDQQRPTGMAALPTRARRHRQRAPRRRARLQPGELTCLDYHQTQ